MGQDALQLLFFLHFFNVKFLAATHHSLCRNLSKPLDNNAPVSAKTVNYDARSTNLCASPLYFSAPLEENVDGFGRVLGLWRVQDLPRGNIACFDHSSSA